MACGSRRDDVAEPCAVRGAVRGPGLAPGAGANGAPARRGGMTQAADRDRKGWRVTLEVVEGKTADPATARVDGLTQGHTRFCGSRPTTAIFPLAGAVCVGLGFGTDPGPSGPIRRQGSVRPACLERSRITARTMWHARRLRPCRGRRTRFHDAAATGSEAENVPISRHFPPCSTDRSRCSAFRDMPDRVYQVGPQGLIGDPRRGSPSLRLSRHIHLIMHMWFHPRRNGP